MKGDREGLGVCSNWSICHLTHGYVKQDREGLGCAWVRACRSNWWICHLTNWYVKPDREGLVVAGKSGHRTRCRRHLVARRGPNRASSWCEWGVCAARKGSKWTPGLGCQCTPRLFKHWVWFGQIVLQTCFAHKVVQERALGQKLSQNVSPSPSCRPSGAESDVFFACGGVCAT